MQSEEIYRAIRATPFRPFRLVLPGGEEVAVVDPEYVGLPPGGRTMVVHPPGRGGIRLVDVGRIVALAFDEPAAAES